MSLMKTSFVSVVALGAAACLFGCSSSDSTAAPAADAGTATDSGTLSLYDRLGGKTGLETFVGNVVDTNILTDADLKTFFFNQVASPIPAGHPSKSQIVVCFARFVGSALQADTYPGAPVADATNTNEPMHTCRDMATAHKSSNTMLNIGSGNFDKFVGYIATALMPLVVANPTKVDEISQAEFNALAAALTGTKSDVTTATAPAAVGPFTAP